MTRFEAWLQEYALRRGEGKWQKADVEAAFRAGMKTMEPWVDHHMTCDVSEFPGEQRTCTCGLTAAQEGR